MNASALEPLIPLLTRICNKASCRTHPTCSHALTRVRITRSDWVGVVGPCFYSVSEINILSRMYSGNSSNWKLTCDHERVVGGCTGLVMTSGQLPMGFGHTPPQSRSSDIKALNPFNLPSNTPSHAFVHSSLVKHA